jgi:hypothetical protein
MPVEQDFLPFANGGSANVLSQSAYAALTSLLQNGFSSGIAQSSQLNKVWRQSSIMAAVLAQFIVNQTGQPAIDDGATATLLTNLTTAIGVAARQNPVLADTGAANAYIVANLSAFTAYPTVSGLVIDVSIANANTGASTLNVDGLGAKPILGLGLQPLQGGELIVKGVASLLYVVATTVNGGNGAWILMECAGGAQQIAPATQSQHAVQMGQVTNQASPLQLATLAATLSNQAVNLGQFVTGSVAGNSYLTIPMIVGGVKRTLILQWMRNITGTANGSGQATITVAFPIAFPTAVLGYSYVPNNESSSVTPQRIVAQGPSTVGQLVNIDGVSASGPCAVSGFAIGW